MNASRLSRIIAEGVHRYAKRQDLIIGSADYLMADADWESYARRQTPEVIAAVKALQATCFDIALDIGSGGTMPYICNRKLSQGLA